MNVIRKLFSSRSATPSVNADSKTEQVVGRLARDVAETIQNH